MLQYTVNNGQCVRMREMHVYIVNTSQTLTHLAKEKILIVARTSSTHGILYTTYLSLSSEYNIDGEEFLQMTRQDVALLFPNEFLLGMRLFRVIEGLHTRRDDEDDSIELFSSDEENAISTPKTTKPTPPKSTTPLYHQGQRDPLGQPFSLNY